MKICSLLFVFLISSEIIYSQVNLTQGLVAYFPFNGNANDASGNGLNGVVSNAILTTDKNGNANSAYYFNGSNSSILLPFSILYDFAANDSFSISVWVLPDLGNSWPAQALVVKSPPNPDFNASNWNYGVYLLNYKAMTGYASNNFLNGITIFSNNPCWYNIIVTYKNGIWNLYVNGVLEASDVSQTKFILQDGTSKIAIGKKGESSGDYYKGKMDEVRIYNRVLNSSEINAIVGNCNRTYSCNNWLKTTNQSDAVTIGDLDVSGNNITVEAVFNRISTYSGSYIYAGDIVSKHSSPSDCNYLLRPNDAEITTTNGFFQTPSICDIDLNKTYHVAMTYDGNYLKFYRNGFLMSQIRATGNLIQNNWLTTFGVAASGTTGVYENMVGFINEVRIWNIVRTQDEIRTYMNTSLPNPTTQTGLLAYYTFDNLNNKQGNSAWNGTLVGSALINQTNTSCSFIADSCKIPPCTNKNDFSFSLNPCSAKTVSFQTNATGYDSIRWNFGDGNTVLGSASTSNTYSDFGNYAVTMITNYPTCADTATKTISVFVHDNAQLITTSDTTICYGSTKQLHSIPSLNSCWTPTDYLDNPNSSNPVTSTPNTKTYYLQALVTGNNLITNGDFSLGNTGFISEYLYSPSSGWNDGVYSVGSDIHAWHSGMASCGDHTIGTGNMLMVNGATTLNVKVWSQTVNVTPNTNYAFSAWLQNISYSNPAALQFSINGNNLGNIFNADNYSCVWKQFYTTWNSGNNTSATISIVNQNNIFNGNDFALDDISFAPITIQKDSVIITVNCLSTCTNKNDFSFNLNPCSPKTVSFQTNATGYDSIRWNFGDGNTFTGATVTSNAYSSYGNYAVTMITNYPTCTDTATKTISVFVHDNAQLITTSDTTICYGSTKQLHSIPGLNSCWTPTDYLDNPNSSNPITSTPQTKTYYLQALVTGNNLITNGDFSLGNTGFTSQYIFANPNTTEGQYYVGTNPKSWNPGMSTCGDHTTGNDNMLLVNGAPVSDQEVWMQTVSVTPNTNYAFSTWIEALSPPNPSQLMFSINGIDVGNTITASLPTCTWTQFYTTWNSGNNNSATISIVNKNIIRNGNDFALDDISFAPVSIQKDSIIITVDTPSVKATHNAIICEKDTVHLNATGASLYTWSPVTGLSSSIVQNPIAIPSVTTKYIVTGTNIFGCTSKDSVIINVNLSPVITLTNDTVICNGSSVQLNASGGISYLWSPSSFLNFNNISNPIAFPDTTIVYYVTATNNFNCNNTDSVTVKVHNPNTFTIKSPAEVCSSTPVQLTAFGGDSYVWSPASLLNNAYIANPVAVTQANTSFYVIVTDTICKLSDTLTTMVNIFPAPVITATKSTDVDCSTPTSNLLATGGLQYVWEPSATLSNPSIANPIAMPVITTKYFVIGTDANSCTSKDSIIVYFSKNNESGYLMPTAFTPNNDGLNDCYGIKYWGHIKELQFSIFNRYGERLFFTTNPNDCWDGTYKGQKQEAGTYIYVIKAKTICCDDVFRKGAFVLIR